MKHALQQTLLMAFMLICAMNVWAQPKEFYIVADDDFPPFSFFKDKQLVGVDIEIIQEMSRRIDLPVKIDLMPWKRLLSMTRKGHCDGSMSLFQTSEREAFAYFTSPIHYSTYVIFVNKTKKFEFNTIQDLFGKRLCKQAGFVISDEFDQAVKREKIRIIDIFDEDTGILTFVNGNADGFVANKQVTMYKLNHNPLLARYKDAFEILPNPIKKRRGAYFVISRASNYPDKLALHKKITATLQAMEADGTYSQIYAKYYE